MSSPTPARLTGSGGFVGFSGRRPASTAFVAACALAAAMALPSAMAQEQERSLMERIERPDMTLSFGAQKQGFYGSRSFSGGKDARVKDFYSPKKFRSKDFLTGAYAGQKDAWMGDFTYNTKNADTEGRGMTRRIVREHKTKDMPVKTSREAGKDYRTRQHAQAERRSDYRGKSQDKIDIHGPQAITTMPRDSGFTKLETIDDIRNLLNKNQ